LEAPAESALAAELEKRGTVIERGWSARLESLRIFWYRRVVSFDRRSQLETLEAVKNATEGSGRYARAVLIEMAKGIRAWVAGPWNAARIGRFAAVVLLGFALVWLWREYGLSAWRRFTHGSGARRDDPIRADASRWLARLASTENSTEENAAVMAELRRLRFGARATWSPPERVFRRARRVVRTNRRRRIMGAIEKP
jgi:hypothetical protein